MRTIILYGVYVFISLLFCLCVIHFINDIMQKVEYFKKTSKCMENYYWRPDQIKIVDGKKEVLYKITTMRCEEK